MKARAVILGFALAAFIASATYFNDWVIQQTQLIGNHLPIGVFGLVLLMLLLLNPLLGLLGVRWTLKPRELAIIAAMGLMVCAWPGANFFRTFFSTVTIPVHEYPSQTAWQSAQVMSYLPGGSAEVASGHVRDWPTLHGEFVAAIESPASPLQRHLAGSMSEQDRLLVRELGREDALQQAGNKRRLLQILNESTIEPTSLTDGAGLAAAVGREKLPPEAIEDLEERDAALAKVEQLEAELAQHKQALAARSAELGPRLDERRAALRQVNDELAAARERLNRAQGGDGAGRVEDLRDAVAERDAQRDEAYEAVRELEEQLAPLRLEVTRTQAKIEYFDLRAVIAERHANRAALVALAPRVARATERIADPNAPPGRGQLSVIVPAPEGSGVLLNDGFGGVYSTSVIRTGTGEQQTLPPTKLPWWAWKNPIMSWGTIAILLTIAVLCMAVIVHPQWSQRELLSYPIVRFMEEVTERPDDKVLPAIMSNKLFWLGFLLVLGIHTLNGLSIWVGDPIPELPLQFDFTGFKELFPTLGKVHQPGHAWEPTLQLSAMAFAYFLNKEVSLSVGLSVWFWGILGTILLSNGLPVENNWTTSDMGPMLRFGAFLGLAVMILYIGRGYYANVATSMVGLPRGKATPAYATWAARAMVVCCVAAGFVLYRYVGLDWPLAALLIVSFLLMSLGMARINAETGLFFVMAYWIPAGVIVGLLGASAVGPEGFLPLALASAVLMKDTREAAAPFFVNALNLGERVGKASPTRTIGPFALVLIVGFAIAFIATISLQHIHGTAYHDNWAKATSPDPFHELVKNVDDLEARGVLTQSNTLSGFERLFNINPEPETFGWMGLGAALVVVFALARLRLNWWPLHPVIFLIWGTFPVGRMWFAFLVGWLIKVMVTKFGGARAFRSALPLMVGVIAAELLSAIGWTIAGAIAFALDIKVQGNYAILPG